MGELFFSFKKYAFVLQLFYKPLVSHGGKRLIRLDSLVSLTSRSTHLKGIVSRVLVYSHSELLFYQMGI